MTQSYILYTHAKATQLATVKLNKDMEGVAEWLEQSALA